MHLNQLRKEAIAAAVYMAGGFDNLVGLVLNLRVEVESENNDCDVFLKTVLAANQNQRKAILVVVLMGLTLLMSEYRRNQNEVKNGSLN